MEAWQEVLHSCCLFYLLWSATKDRPGKGNCTRAVVSQSKGIQDSLEYWIPCHRLRIPGTGFRILCQWNLDPGFQSLEGFQSPWDVLQIPKPRIPDSTSKNFPSLRKQPTFGDATTGFPAKWRLRNERRNSILIPRHYPDLGSASDRSCRVGNLIQPIRSTTQASSVWNFCFRFSDVIWRENQW